MKPSCLFKWLNEICYEQESSAFREIPVVIMSSENILTRIDRYRFPLFFNFFLVLGFVVLSTSMGFLLYDSCLKEGAEEFLVKPVKLSDVKRLKDFIMKGENGEKRIGLKRKLDLDHDHDHDQHPLSAPAPEAFDCQGFLQLSPPLSRASPIRCSSKKPRLLTGDQSI